jgi:hypothetical protein
MTLNSSRDHLNPKLVQAAREAFLRTNLDKSAASSPTTINRTKVSDQISAQERLFRANKKHLLKSQILTHSQTGSSSNKNVCFTKSIAKIPSNKAGENDQALLPASFILSANSLQISQHVQSFSSFTRSVSTKSKEGYKLSSTYPRKMMVPWRQQQPSPKINLSTYALWAPLPPLHVSKQAPNALGSEL